MDTIPNYGELLDMARGMSAKASTSPWLFTGEDALRLRVFNSAAGVQLAVEGRVLRFDGIVTPFAFSHVPATDRSETTVIELIGDGFLLNLSVRASAGTPRRGQCYATVEVVRAQTGFAQPLGALVAGYVTDTGRLFWPGMRSHHSTEGPGVLRAITGTDPAAAAEVTETVPTNARWLLHFLNVTLVTSATVANRFPELRFDDGAGVVFFSTDPDAAVAASSSQNFQYASGLQRNAATIFTKTWNCPVRAPLQGGFRILTATVNLQAGDNWTAPLMLVEEWIED